VSPTNTAPNGPATLCNLLERFYPFTIQGTFSLLAASGALVRFGYGSMDLVVFSLAVCALTIVVFFLISAVAGGMFIRYKLNKELQSTQAISAASVEAGFPNETGFTLPLLGYIPLVKLSWQIVYPDFVETRVATSLLDKQLVEEIVPIKRCKTDHITRQFTVSDVLGFSRYSWQQEQPLSLMALPQTNTVKPLPLLQSLTAEDGIPNPSGNPDGDRMEIRPYVPGDSVRNIMWKVYARNRQLNVRLAEKSVFPSKRTVAYLLSSDNDEAAAAVARVALQSGALGDDWAFGADGTDVACDSIESSLVAIAQSRGIGKHHGYGLDDFLQLAAGQTSTHCIVFAAAEMAPWLNALKQTAGRYKGQFSIVLATDGFSEERTQKLWQRLLFKQKLANDESLGHSSPRSDLIRLLTDLGQLVESTLIVDRKTGFSFDQTLKKV
jgi:hypothetical protein